jgi:hypothetical protein
MLRATNSPAASGSRHSSQKHQTAPRADCLLCRVLWPTILPHRHLLIEASSEAQTLCSQRCVSNS